MKRLMKSLVVAVVALSMSMTALAVESPSSGYVVKSIISAESASGTDVSLILGDVDDDTLADIGEVTVDGYNYIEYRLVTIEGDASLIDFPITVVFEATGVTAGTSFQAMYYNGSEWVTINGVAGAGTITLELDSFEDYLVLAFAFDSTTDDTTTSPETGEVNMVAMAAMVGCGAMAMVFVLRKKAVK